MQFAHNLNLILETLHVILERSLFGARDSHDFCTIEELKHNLRTRLNAGGKLSPEALHLVLERFLPRLGCDLEIAMPSFELL